MTAAKPRVLYVDDEMNNLVAFRALFRKEFEVFTASSAQEGMSILQKEEADVVITDQRMPQVRGVQFLEMVMRAHPHAVRMLITGYSDIEAIIEAVNKTHIYKCLRKPWDNEEIADAIREGYILCLRSKRSAALLQRFGELEGLKGAA